jgi:glycerol-3-phosphate dehydrogenase
VTAHAGLLARRRAALERLGNEEVDVLVVGGGATGAGVARDAVLRGLSVALCEAGDFAGQTSSRSSQLIHGGLRYLQYGDLGLVFEGLSERRRLMSTAPHLCRPIEFLFPAYRGERPSLRTIGTGIALYNALALWRPPTQRRRLDPGATFAASPLLRAAGLQGAQQYIDCQTDDARLVLETILDAERAGAVVLSHARVRSLRRDRTGRARAALIADQEGDGASGPEVEARARVIVNATGPFSDAFDRGRRNLRPTLGVHLVFDAARLDLAGRAVVLRAPRDGRVFFALPRGRRSVIGTTDTDWPSPSPARAAVTAENGHGAPGASHGGLTIDAEIRARREDVDYLLEAAAHAFPAARLGPGDVIATFAGLRPLIAAPAHTASSTSREHEILREADGVVTIAGGKLTTFRRMAEETTDALVEILRDRGLERAIGPCVTRTRPLPGAFADAPEGAGRSPSSLGDHELAEDVRDHLLATYGSRSADVLAEVEEAPDLARRIDPELPYLWAEIVHAAREEHALEVEDALARRAPLLRDARDQGLGAAERAGDLMARVLGWTPERRARSVEKYRAAVAVSRKWRE